MGEFGSRVRGSRTLRQRHQDGKNEISIDWQYQNCLRKFHANKDTTILMYLAKCYFDAGKLEECKTTVLQAIHINPSNKAFWFNLALTQGSDPSNDTSEQYATTVKKERYTLQEAQKALSELKQALVNFKSIAEMPNPTPKEKVLAEKASKHYRYIDVRMIMLTSTEYDRTGDPVGRSSGSFGAKGRGTAREAEDAIGSLQLEAGSGRGREGEEELGDQAAVGQAGQVLSLYLDIPGSTRRANSRAWSTN